MLGGCIKFLREGREVKNSKASNTEMMKLKIIIILESIEMANLSYFRNRILRLNFQPAESMVRLISSRSSGPFCPACALSRIKGVHRTRQCDSLGIFRPLILIKRLLSNFRQSKNAKKYIDFHQKRPKFGQNPPID